MFPPNILNDKYNVIPNLFRNLTTGKTLKHGGQSVVQGDNFS